MDLSSYKEDFTEKHLIDRIESLHPKPNIEIPNENLIEHLYNQICSFAQIILNMNEINQGMYMKSLKTIKMMTDNVKIPYDESITKKIFISSSDDQKQGTYFNFFEYCLEKYKRAHQDSKASACILGILTNFALSDEKYIELITYYDFIGISIPNIIIFYPSIMHNVMIVLNCIINNNSTHNLFSTFPISIILKKIPTSCDYNVSYEMLNFLVFYLDNKNINKDVVTSTMMTFNQFKNPDYLPDHCGTILLLLIRTDHFDFELFIKGPLLPYFVNNFYNKNHFGNLSTFYAILISKFSEHINLIPFDYSRFFGLLQNPLVGELTRKYIYFTFTCFLMVFQTDKSQIFSRFPIEFFVYLAKEVIQLQMTQQLFFNRLYSLLLLAVIAYLMPEVILKEIDVLYFIYLYEDVEDPLWGNNFLTVVVRAVMTLLETSQVIVADFQSVCQHVSESKFFENLIEIHDKLVDGNNDELLSHINALYQIINQTSNVDGHSSME